jgi:starch synthase
VKIAVVTSEVMPFSKTGGLADVCGALPGEFEKAGHEVRVVSPLYRGVKARGPEPTGIVVRVPLGATVEAGVARIGRHWFLEHDSFYGREGLYGTPKGDYPDNAARFAMLSRGALELFRETKWIPDVIHVHDWQTSLVPIYLKTIYAKEFARSRSVLTVHNLAYQGVFWHLDMPLFGLDWALFNWRELEFFGKVNLLKGGIVFADAITTVSPTYAKEIQTRLQGCGLDGVLAQRTDRLFGILNGIDTTEWDPATDKHLPATYSTRSMEGKAACKKALQEKLGLPVRPDVPIFGFIGRLAEQKGIDLLVGAAEYLTQLDLQMVILGSGEARYQTPLKRLGTIYKKRLAVSITFDEALAHLIEAGSDFFLMPSRYEPCGLNQMYSLRYGTVPIVRRTGGLADTVDDGRNGILFQPYTVDGLVGAVERAMALWARRDAYAFIQFEGMRQDHSWAGSAQKYLELFDRLVKETRVRKIPRTSPPSAP